MQKLKPNVQEKNLRLSILSPNPLSQAAGPEAKELHFLCLEWAPSFLLPLPGPVTRAIASALWVSLSLTSRGKTV